MNKYILLTTLFLSIIFVSLAQPGWNWPKKGIFLSIQIDETLDIFTKKKVLKDSLILKVGDGIRIHNGKTTEWPFENIIIDLELNNNDTISILLESSSELIKINLVNNGLLTRFAPTRLFLEGIPKDSGTYFIHLNEKISEQKHEYYLDHASYNITPVDWDLIKREK